MKPFFLTLCLILAAMSAATNMVARADARTPCGGDFKTWLGALKKEARDKGASRKTVKRFFAGVVIDSRTLKADRSQKIFQLNFIEFSTRVISKNRQRRGAKLMKHHAEILKTGEERYGIPAAIIVALWGLETDFGLVQGNYNTLNSLITLAHDCRRPDLFRPQIFAAITLFERGDFDPATSKGAWAGEMGMVQMLPSDFLTNGIDGDGDGVVSISNSPNDALLSGMKMLGNIGWHAGEPWLQEVRVPASLDWSRANLDTLIAVEEWKQLGLKARKGQLVEGLDAALLLPHGHRGPAFLAYPNFFVFFKWNQSLNYVISAAHFAAQLNGDLSYEPRQPETGLGSSELIALQRKLGDAGYEVGKIDGILGHMTRAAVQKEQARLGYPADAWPTKIFYEEYLSD